MLKIKLVQNEFLRIIKEINYEISYQEKFKIMITNNIFHVTI